MITELTKLHDLFIALCDGLDSDEVDGNLMLRPDGSGHFHLIEQHTGTVKYPPWARAGRNQADWLSLDEANDALHALLRRKHECRR